MESRTRILTAGIGLALVVSGAIAVLASCRSLPAPSYVVASPAGSETWTAVDALPDWVAAPPRSTDRLVFVIENRSNLRSIAAHQGGPRPDREAAARVRAALGPGLDAADVERVVAALPAAQRLVARAAKDEVLTHRMVPGNTLSTVWALWEAPLDDVVAPLAPEQRAAARRALAGE